MPIQTSIILGGAYLIEVYCCQIRLIHYAYESLTDAYISRYGDFCAHNDNNNDTTDYTGPLVHARGVNICVTQ